MTRFCQTPYQVTEPTHFFSFWVTLKDKLLRAPESESDTVIVGRFLFLVACDLAGGEGVGSPLEWRQWRCEDAVQDWG